MFSWWVYQGPIFLWQRVINHIKIITNIFAFGEVPKGEAWESPRAVGVKLNSGPAAGAPDER